MFCLFEAIIKRKEYHLPPTKIRRLDFAMRQFPLLHVLLVRVLRFCLVTLPLVDIYLNFEEFHLGHGIMLLIWNCILFLSLQTMVAVGVLISQEIFLLCVYYIYRLQSVKAKLSKTTLHFTQSDSLPDHSLFVVRRTFPQKKLMVPFLRWHLRELVTICSAFLCTSEQIKYMHAVTYFLLSGMIEFNLYLVFSRSTKPILRAISSFLGFSMAFLLFLAMGFMGRLNSKSKRLLPEVNCCLFKVKLFRTRATTRKLALAETQHLIASDRLSFNLADIFSMTWLQLLLGCFTIVTNVFLIISLNK